MVCQSFHTAVLECFPGDGSLLFDALDQIGTYLGWEVNEIES